MTLAEDLSGFADRISRDLELDLVQDATTASRVGEFWLAFWKRQRLTLRATAFWNVLAAEKYDTVSIANHPVLASLGDAGLVFRVVEKRYRLADENPARIELALVETNP